MKTNRKSAEFQPNRVLSYFKVEWRALLIVTVSGLIYNIGTNMKRSVWRSIVRA